MIPLFKPAIAPSAPAQVGEVLLSGYVGQGEQSKLFEEELSALSERDLVPVVVNSCTSALTLALHLLGVGAGDEVISTPMTCTATNSAIIARGARLVWADVNPLTGVMDAKDVAHKITSKTKAIVTVDWAGEPPDYRALRSYGIPVVEDAAHRLMPDPKNHGDIVCLSFQAIKYLTTGDGGALLVPPAYRDRAMRLRWYGLERRSVVDQDVVESGYKFHMNDIAATLGRANLKLAQANLMQQRKNAEYYYRYLGHRRKPFQLPHDAYYPSSTYWLFTVLVERERDRFISEMAEAGIECSRVHVRNDTLHAYRGRFSDNLPGVAFFDTRQVNVPVGWWLSTEDRERIKDALLRWSL